MAKPLSEAELDSALRHLAGLLLQAADREDIGTMRQDLYIASADFEAVAHTLLATVDAYREIVDALAHEADYQAETGEGSMAYLARLITKARALLGTE